ncbi:protein artemis isoform X2 [Magallana gigas]|uniref:protein artemis isoform X2 n=1 Tax=Magallana gigas TaxID=29159 RepID=UPI003342B287
MSCFKGKMREYQNISLDRFDGLNLKSTVYFLSHCHCDHMEGLASAEFLDRLSSRNDIFLYCSEVTKILLMEKLAKLEKFVKVLKVGEPSCIPIPAQNSAKTEKVTVTLIHASHCPGSVMFLFEGYDGTALYTGDFRWESDQIQNVPALHVDQRVKPLASLYVDTTFCHPNSFLIPSRRTIIKVVCDLVTEWTSKGSNYVVHFTPRANYGHEPLLKEVAQTLGCKVHVKKDKENIYNQMSELQGVFTSDSTATPLHACGMKVYGKPPRLPCNLRGNLKVMVILPSTMFFTQSVHVSEREIVLQDRGMYRVCYCFHSSMQEVRDLVTYLQPRQVFPNVKPVEDKTLHQVQQRLNEFLKLKHSSRVREAMDSQRPLGLLKGTLKKRKKKPSETLSESEELLFGSQSLSPKKFSNAIVSPAKNNHKEETEDEEGDQSSYDGSCHSDSELSGICELDEESSQSLSTPRQSLLEAINSLDGSQSESLSHRIVVYDDCEQTEGKALSLEELNKQYQEGEEDIDSGSVSDQGDPDPDRGSSPPPETTNIDKESEISRSNKQGEDAPNNSKSESVELSDGQPASGSGDSNYNGSSDLFDGKLDEMSKKSTISEKSSYLSDLHITPSSCDSQSNVSSRTGNSQSNACLSISDCDSQSNVSSRTGNSQSNTYISISDCDSQSNVSVSHCDCESNVPGSNCDSQSNSSNGNSDESESDDEDCPTEISSQESKTTTDVNATRKRKHKEDLDDIDALFEVESSDSDDDDVKIVEDPEPRTSKAENYNRNTRKVVHDSSGPSTSLLDFSRTNTSLQEESDSDATLPPSQNSYSESPQKRRLSSEDSVEIIDSTTLSVSTKENSHRTPRKLQQTSMDHYVSPLEDSPEKFSPSIVKRRKRCTKKLNVSHRKLMYKSNGEECSGDEEVVDLTL